MKKWFPVLALILALIIQVGIKNAAAHPPVKAPYFTYALLLGLVVYLVFLALSFANKKIAEKTKYKSAFISVWVLLLTLLNVLTAKLAFLPVLYFPTADKIFGVFVNDLELLAKCLGYSLRLLGYGYFSGALAGLCTGIFIGFNKKANYWIAPLVRIIGPIPSSAWIPLVLVSFPSAVSASSFLIALSVWFPTTLMTSSGIFNIQNSYFEVSATLGAGPVSKIWRVGIPAAMPHIFLGLFNGTCASFITLVTAEMIGAKYGIGWYINWQKDMLAYANVYAGLILTAVVFSILVTILFRLRDKLLLWQKGVIKW
ncbi:MAG: ABC transporter permease subunit [Lachnospiraceae bacterium]|jgi:NitT/TauT family transport system permease protein|nr:ABC transporter permease subunit [Lachnospiraceae bacterium]